MIFQGVRGDVLGVPLHQVAEHTDIAVTDLPETERSQVSDGIYASDGLDDARRLVERLRGADARAVPGHPADPGRGARPGPAAGGAEPGAPVDPAQPPPVDTTPVPTVPPQPGTTCRPVG